MLGGSLKSSFLVVGRNPFGHSEPISLATTTGTTFAIAVIVLAVPIEVEQVEKVADRTPIGARTLIAARQGFTDVDKVAVTGTAT